MTSSSSFHRLSADKRLRRPARAAYRLLNWLNRRFPSSGLDPTLEIRTFRLSDALLERLERRSTNSPSRQLSDLFLETLPWQKMADVLGPLHVFDMGCGKGGYAPFLLACSQGTIESYVGIDMRPHAEWAELEAHNPDVRFLVGTSDEAIRLIPEDTNLFVSVSALEHFEGDIDFFRLLRDFAGGQFREALHVHLVPAASAAVTYPYHGVRQYTPRTISRITRLFPETDRKVLMGLGGPTCNRVHAEWITRPIIGSGTDRRETDPQGYAAACRAALEQDARATIDDPAGYALVLHVQPTTDLFGIH